MIYHRVSGTRSRRINACGPPTGGIALEASQAALRLPHYTLFLTPHHSSWTTTLWTRHWRRLSWALPTWPAFARRRGRRSRRLTSAHRPRGGGVTTRLEPPRHWDTRLSRRKVVHSVSKPWFGDT